MDSNGQMFLDSIHTFIESNKILIATDSKQIIDFCKLNSMNCVKTSSKCLTGTDRVAEVAKKIKKNVYIFLKFIFNFFKIIFRIIRRAIIDY